MSPWPGCGAQVFGQTPVERLLWRYFFRCDQHLNQSTWSTAGFTPSCVYRVSFYQLKVLRQKDERFVLLPAHPQEEAILPPDSSSWGSPACPADFRPASPATTMNLFLKINVSLWIDGWMDIHPRPMLHTYTHILLVLFLWRTLIQISE